MMEGIKLIIDVSKTKRNVLSKDDIREILQKLYKVCFNVKDDVKFEVLRPFGMALLRSTYAYSAVAKDNVFFKFKMKEEEEFRKVSFLTLSEVIKSYKSELSLRGFMKRLSIEFKEDIYVEFKKYCNKRECLFMNPSLAKRWTYVDSPNDFFYTDVFADSIIPENVRYILKMQNSEFREYVDSLKNKNNFNWVNKENYTSEMNQILRVIFTRAKNAFVNNQKFTWNTDEINQYTMASIKKMSSIYNNYNDILFTKFVKYKFNYIKNVVMYLSGNENVLENDNFNVGDENENYDNSTNNNPNNIINENRTDNPNNINDENNITTNSNNIINNNISNNSNNV